ncbi:MAG: fumarylacetoacetate hydrolase family protein [Paracoccus sp. (in: a-proteobacteria)]|uniref:fumarylacetoacetate hydrolase family protein n=1 Tax=Paracoccus sp. TaxID=267 RepID=UPI0026DFAA00|nr:fumarylacetoacetate hydrolase family protein [Paracoccus sp. (in: a-proteobacteria)]MDO5613002.1 fumarylacetoacetate hydrolase family protein [Paracoccus sp. (in: a-proteobacteria)]
MTPIFDLPRPALPLDGTSFPVRRIFCIGRNYADHAAEMGNAVDREKPFFFTKSAHALAHPGAIPYPPGTADLHHEVELVLAIGAPLSNASEQDAAAAIIARAVGLDLTRRDLQAEAKDKRRPWDAAKDFEASAVIAPLSAARPGPGIRLSVNGDQRQNGRLADMIFPEAALVAFLSTLYHLQPGDLVMTGTPAGVGPLQRGDTIRAEVDGLPALTAQIT